jgi:hypothetical protein
MVLEKVSGSARACALASAQGLDEGNWSGVPPWQTRTATSGDGISWIENSVKNSNYLSGSAAMRISAILVYRSGPTTILCRHSRHLA